MLNIRKTKLKYVCSSFSSNISTTLITAERNNDSIYEVYGASGIIGYHKFYYYNKEYLGIIKDGAGVGRINLYPKNTSLLGTMAYIIPKTNIDINWLKYCISSLNLSESLDKTTIPHIYFSDYGNKEICIYPLDYQKTIAIFLDNKCEKIDQIYKDVEKQIETLEQYKRSIIAESVTKGLNKNACYKESGMKWIGTIPAHWKIEKIKYNFKRNEKRNPGRQQILSVYREYGVIPKDSRDDNHNVTSEDVSKYKYVKPGYLVINKMKAWQGSMGVSKFEGVVSPAYFIFEFSNNIFNKKYIHYLLRGCYKDEFRRLSGGIREGQWDLSPEGFLNTLILIPPIIEQNEIVEYIDKKCAEIDSIIEDKKKQLEILENYKKSLIYEYVTGKKEVPCE